MSPVPTCENTEKDSMRDPFSRQHSSTHYLNKIYHTYIMNSLFILPKATVSSLRRPVVYTAAFIAAMNIMTSAQAAIFTAGFETSEGYDNSAFANVAGQKGWRINDSEEQISFFVGEKDSPNNLAALGGYFDEPEKNRVVLEHGVNTSFDKTRVNLSFGLRASTDEYPDRDKFSVIFDDDNNPDNVPLFSISFEPDAVLTDRLNMVWYDALNTRTSSLNALSYGGLFDLSVEFNASGADTLFSARVEEPLSSAGINFNGLLAGSSTASLVNLGVGFTRGSKDYDFGDNYIVFDNVDVSKVGAQQVPETGAGLAWLAVLGVLGMGRVFVSGRSRTA